MVKPPARLQSTVQATASGREPARFAPAAGRIALEPRLMFEGVGPAGVDVAISVFDPVFSTGASAALMRPAGDAGPDPRLALIAGAPVATLDADVREVDADDTLRFAIVVQNLGQSARRAFDATVRDQLPPDIDPATVANLRLTLGDGRIVYDGTPGTLVNLVRGDGSPIATDADATAALLGGTGASPVAGTVRAVAGASALAGTVRAVAGPSALAGTVRAVAGASVLAAGLVPSEAAMLQPDVLGPFAAPPGLGDVPRDDVRQAVAEAREAMPSDRARLDAGSGRLDLDAGGLFPSDGVDGLFGEERIGPTRDWNPLLLPPPPPPPVLPAAAVGTACATAAEPPLMAVDDCVLPPTAVDDCVLPPTAVDDCVLPLMAVDDCVLPPTAVDDCVLPLTAVDDCEPPPKPKPNPVKRFLSDAVVRPAPSFSEQLDLQKKTFRAPAKVVPKTPPPRQC